MIQNRLKSYISSVSKAISTEEAQAINRLNSQLNVPFFIKKIKTKGVIKQFKEKTTNELQVLQFSLLLLEVNEELIQEEEPKFDYGYFLHCIDINKEKLLIVKKQNPILIKLLGIGVIYLLQKKHLYENIERFIEKLLYILCKIKTILQDSFMYKIFIILTAFNTEKKIKTNTQIPFSMFGQLSRQLCLLENYFPGEQNLLELMRILIHICSQIFMFNESCAMPKNFYRYLFENEKFFIMKKENMEKYQLRNRDEFVETLEKYALVDRDYHKIILAEIESWSQLEVKKQNMVNIFSVVIKIMNRQLFSGYEDQVFKMLMNLTKNSEKQKIEILKFFLYELLENTKKELILRNKNLLYNFAFDKDLKEMFLRYFYKKMQNEKEIQKCLYNYLIQWNIELQTIPAKDFIANIFEKGLEYLKFQTETKIFQCQKDSVIRMIDILMVSKAKRIFEQRTINTKQFFDGDFLKNNTYTYKSFCSLFLQILTSKKVTENMLNENHLQISPFFSKSFQPIKQWMTILVMKAFEKKQLQKSLFQDIIMICSILETEEFIGSKSKYFMRYIVMFLNKGEYDLSEILLWLEKVFLLLKSKLPLYLALCVFLINYIRLTNKSSEFPEKSVIIMKQFVKNIEKDKLLCYSSYYTQSLKLALLLNLYGTSEIKQIMKILVVSWTPLYTKYDIDLILYQFDRLNYKSLLTEFELPNIEEKMKKSSIILQTFNMIMEILESKEIPKVKYLNNFNNCICIIPVKTNLNEKTNISISFSFLLNWNMSHGLSIEFHSRDGNTTYKHKIAYEKELFSITKPNKKERGVSKILKKNTKEELKFLLKLQNSKLTLIVDQEEKLSQKFPFSLQCIKIQLFSGVLISNFTWSCEKFERKLQFLSNYEIFSEAEVKLKKKLGYEISPLNQKINFEQLFLILKSLLMNNVKQLNLSGIFSGMFSIIFSLSSNKSIIQGNQTLIHDIFNSILKQSSEQNRIEFPKILQGKKIHQQIVKNYSDLILFSIINKHFFMKTTFEGKKSFIQFFKHSIVQNQSFLLQVENKTNQYFQTLVEILYTMSQTLTEIQHAHFIIQLIHSLFLHHEINQILLDKFGYYFYAMIRIKNQSNILAKSFCELLKKLSHNLILVESKNNLHDRLLSKYIIEQYSKIQYVLLVADEDTKIKILDYFSSSLNLMPKFMSLLISFPKEEFLSLMDWILVKNKMYVSAICDKKQQTSLNIKMIKFFFETLIKCEPLIEQQEQRDDALSSSVKFIFYVRHKQKMKQKISDEISQLACNQYLIIMITRLVLKFEFDEEQKRKTIEGFIYECFSMIFKMPKYILMKALKLFRKHVQENLKLIIYIIKLDFLLTLPVYALNALLQFFIEVILRVRDSTPQTEEIYILIERLKKFIESLIKTYSSISQIKKPLLYVFPRLQKEVNLNKPEIIKDKLLKIKNSSLYELKGGIFFKIICIIFHLMEIQPNEDFSNIIHNLLSKISESTKKNDATFRAVADFIHISKETSGRTPMNHAVKEVEQQHEEYCEKYEKFNIEKNQNLGVQQKKIEEDLTPFLLDYFFMKLSIFLENNCLPSYQQHKINSLKNYSELFLGYLKKFHHIYDQMNDKNREALLQIQDLEELLNYQQKDSKLLVTDKVNSVHSGIRSRKSSMEMEAIQKQIQIPQSPKKLKKRLTVQEMNRIGSTKKEIFENLGKNMFNWLECKKIKFHRYFRRQSKEILLFELFHEYYVSTSSHLLSQTIPINKGQKLNRFLQTFQGQLGQRISYYKKKNEKSRQKVKKIQHFTTKEKPILQSKGKRMPNLASPWFRITKGSKYKLRQFGNTQAIFDMFTEEIPEFTQELFQTKLKDSQYQEPSYVITLNEQQVEIEEEEQDNFCEISNRKGVFFCEFNLEEKRILFLTKKEKPKVTDESKRFFKYGSPDSNIIQHEGKQKVILPEEVYEIYFRKFNQIKHNSLEFFLKDGRSYFIIFYTTKRARKFLEECLKKYQALRTVKIIDNFVEEFQKRKYTEKWTTGQISNFDYLMLVNKFSGRSLNDLNQYFVFPWILSDYSSKSFDLNKNSIYRDLKKPIGALNPAKLQRSEEKLKNQIDLGERYLYGSHYSTSLFIAYYLVRLQPFTTLQREMQGGDFDHPDRLFSSFSQMWQCLMSESCPTDIKEAIPEFYYFPLFLTNINNIEFGVKQIGTRVDSVELPKWAENPFDFTMKMRAALQSDFVSSQLHHWIDLIFGKDQYSFQKKNVFLPTSYHEKIKLEEVPLNNLDAIASQVTYYGQNPYVLFKKQHPTKKQKIGTSLQETSERLNVSRVDLDIKNYVNSINKYGFEVSLEIYDIKKDQLKYILLSMQNPTQTIIKIIERNQDTRKRSTAHDNKIYETEIQASIQNYEIKILQKDSKHFLHSFSLPEKNYTKFLMNQMVFVLYGSSMLKVFDWNQNLIFHYHSEVEEISCCHLDTFFVLFSTSGGKLFGYDMISKKKIKLYEYQKKTIKIEMIVYPERRLITKNNEIGYKILMIGDQRRCRAIYFRHPIGEY